MERFVKETRINTTPEKLYEWHMQPGAFDKLVPPWQKVEVLERPKKLKEGAVLLMKVYAGPIGVRWVARHQDFVEGRQFVDDQVHGPFESWTHTHEFLPDGHGGAILRDSIDYELPAGKLGEVFGSWFARRMLERMFNYRHEKTAAELEGDQTSAVPPNWKDESSRAQPNRHKDG
ncbi:SRPBCC family protein [Persicimonas caeni]|nr:SRPBCC family protein [Persicimonas caeni]